MPSIAPDKAALMPSDQQGLPLSGKSVLIIEDEALIALSVESCLLAAGAAVVKIANSISASQSALDEGIFSMRRLSISTLEMTTPTPWFRSYQNVESQS